MAILKLAALDAVLRKPEAGIAAFLVYGPDSGKVREVARRIVAAVAGSPDDPFRVVEIDDQSLNDDPARLADELQSMAMGGGGRAIWIADAGQGLAARLAGLDVARAGDNRIVAEAANLPKSARLRTAFETSRHAYAIACYEDTVEDLNDLIDAAAATAGLSVTDEARGRLLALLGNDRSLSRSEVDKVVLYCRGRDAITLADVEAVASDKAAAGLDQFADAVFCGEAAAADLLLARFFESGEPGSRALSALGFHAAVLQRLALEVEAGTSQANAIRAARPPLFFGRHGKVADQLRLWTAATLANAADTAAKAVQQTREFPVLENQIASRAALSLARMAASFRVRPG